MNLLFKCLARIKKSIDNRVRNFGNQFTIFGIFGALNYPIYWLIWHFFSMQTYENLTLRVIATLLCVPLIFNKYWPSSLKTWLPLYWYTTLTFCLPFFFTFMLLENNASNVWLMSTTAVLFWLILLVDGLSFIFILSIGLTAGCALYYFSNNTLPLVDYKGIISQYFGTLLVGLLFAHSKENLEKAKLQGIKTVGASIAHELRTPLSSIRLGIEGTKQYLPTLIEGYKEARKHDLLIKPIQNQHLEILATLLDDLEKETRYSGTIVDMLLMNTKQNTAMVTGNFKQYSIIHCVSEALRRYPFKDEQAKLIVLNSKNDFLFRGDQLLMEHVLFNLIKNALYFIEAANKGNITIWYEHKDNYNVLYFKDTGKGVPSHLISKLFERFYTTTPDGTGLGLAFCKMVMSSFGGSIKCKSKYGEYTQFELIFPRLGQI